MQSAVENKISLYRIGKRTGKSKLICSHIFQEIEDNAETLLALTDFQTLEDGLMGLIFDNKRVLLLSVDSMAEPRFNPATAERLHSLPLHNPLS